MKDLIKMIKEINNINKWLTFKISELILNQKHSIKLQFDFFQIYFLFRLSINIIKFIINIFY